MFIFKAMIKVRSLQDLFGVGDSHYFLFIP
jgi:hypothetical protein